jgi:PTH1 family peptidyl-tRNA hydrolase
MRYDVRLRVGREADSGSWGTIQLMKPTTMMNLSGRPIQAAMTRNNIEPAEILVIHDDLDLPLGRLRFKLGGGGSGGARGVEDLIYRIGPDFPRLKLGIGRPPKGLQNRNWVLSRFSPDESTLLDRVINNAADAVEHLLQENINSAMTWANSLDLTKTDSEESLS